MFITVGTSNRWKLIKAPHEVLKVVVNETMKYDREVKSIYYIRIPIIYIKYQRFHVCCYTKIAACCSQIGVESLKLQTCGKHNEYDSTKF